MALSMLRDSVRGLPCQVSMAGALLVARILWQLGYVRVAYGALYVASQYSCRTAAARGDSTGAVLGQGGALGLTVSFLMLPGASVLVWYSRIQRRSFCVQCRSWCASATDFGEIAEVVHSCDVELIGVRQCPDHGKSRSSSALVMWILSCAPVPQIMGVSQWEVPQTQFIAWLWPSQLHRDRGLSARGTRDEGVGAHSHR